MQSEIRPSADNYIYYLNIKNRFRRYKKLQCADGNSAIDIDDPNQWSNYITGY